MSCQYCNREILNPGSLRSHEKCCALNPKRVKRTRSPNAGKQKGCVSWNKGKNFEADNLQRSLDFFKEGKYRDCVEPIARKHAKRVLTNQHGNVCQICGVSEWMGQPVPLVCDHISGDSTDNRFENFRLVCCNCDAQLPTFKSKNKGRGRQYDRELYRRRVNQIGD